MKLLTMADVSDLLIFCLLARGVKVVYRTKELEEQQASRIRNETWLAGFFYKPCNHKLFLKQALNMEMAIVMARYSIRRLLADVPDDVDMVIFPNYESSVEHDDIKDPFSELPCYLRSLPYFCLVYNPRNKFLCSFSLPLLPCGNATMKGLTCWLSRSTRSTTGKASRKPQHERAMTLKGCEEEFLMIAEYTSLLAYNQGRIISVYAKQPASWVCASCLSEREDLCWAVKGCARIWWSNSKRSLQLQLRFVRFMGKNQSSRCLS
ncbi:hypothetical protein VPH35_041219 [Triticum aestivum]